MNEKFLIFSGTFSAFYFEQHGFTSLNGQWSYFHYNAFVYEYLDILSENKSITELELPIYLENESRY